MKESLNKNIKQRQNVSHKTLRFLYAKSGNQCAFPQCNLPIFEDYGVFTGECCHIEAYSKGGARFNTSTTNEEKNSESNLILMCARHHTIIDADCLTYSVEVLKQMKHDHEQKFSGNKRALEDKMLFALEHSINAYWRKMQAIDANDDSDFKIKIEPNTDIHTLIDNIVVCFKHLEDFFSIMAESDEKLPTDLKVLCERTGVNYSLFEKIPYWENKFENRLWEIHSLGVHNVSNHLKMYFLQFCVNIFAELSKYESAYYNILQEYKNKLEDHHKHNYYLD